MTYFSTPDGAEIWAGRGGFVSTRSAVDPDSYYLGADRRFAGLLLEDRVTRFDASDVMPAAIGSDLLWRQITAWIARDLTLDELVESVDTARAAL
jgi:alpha-glucoside transport system substrate-binding protein